LSKIEFELQNTQNLNGLHKKIRPLCSSGLIIDTVEDVFYLISSLCRQELQKSILQSLLCRK
jgi:hypothetical protein